MTALIILLVLFFLLIFLNLPIAFAAGLSSCTALLYMGTNLTVAIQRVYNSIDSFTLLAIPFFVFAGNIFNASGISTRLMDFAATLCGGMKGGLHQVDVVGSMLFGGISGSGAADVSAVSSILLPQYRKRGYDVAYGAALGSTSGSIGCIIPPSIPMIVYAATAEVSVSQMFMGGIIPGIMAGVALMILSALIGRRPGYPIEPRCSLKEIWKSFKNAIWSLLAIVVIIGGIFGGIFTATEAGAAACLYGLLVGFFIYRELKLKDLPKILLQTALTTANIMFLVGATAVFGWILTVLKVPAAITGFIFGITKSKVIILLMINVVLLLAGMFLTESSAILLFVPLLLPLATELGMSPIAFGVMMVFNLTLGLSTPPVGACLFTACSIAGLSMTEIVKPMMKCLIAMIIVLMLITFFPNIFVMPIPNLIG